MGHSGLCWWEIKWKQNELSKLRNACTFRSLNHDVCSKLHLIPVLKRWGSRLLCQQWFWLETLWINTVRFQFSSPSPYFKSQDQNPGIVATLQEPTAVPNAVPGSAPARPMVNGYTMRNHLLKQQIIRRQQLQVGLEPSVRNYVMAHGAAVQGTGVFLMLVTF